MNKQVLILFSSLILLISCDTLENKGEIGKWKAEVIQVEQDFNDLAQKIGLADAFYKYAAHNGVIRKSGKLIEGKDAIRMWIKADIKPNETLTWRPTFVDVSQSGDLAYTYGDATFTYIDSLGKIIEKTSVYHTVWKRQEDETWKFVWD